LKKKKDEQGREKATERARGDMNVASGEKKGTSNKGGAAEAPEGRVVRNMKEQLFGWEGLQRAVKWAFAKVRRDRSKKKVKPR